MAPPCETMSRLDTHRRHEAHNHQHQHQHHHQPSKKLVLHRTQRDTHGIEAKRARTKSKDAKTGGGGGDHQDRKSQTHREATTITTTTTTTSKATATTTTTTSEKPPTLSREQLMKISQEVIEHTKQLGLFDEMRMKLLSRMESRPEFQRVEQDFKRELDVFCKNEADLTKPRAELRKQLIDRLGPSEQPKRTTLSSSLDKNIDYIVQKYRRDLLRKCNETARDYLLEQYGTPGSQPKQQRSR